LRKSKRESWQDFCSKIETMHESARLHKPLSKTHVNEPVILRLPHGWTKSPEEANEHLMDVHFPGCCIDRTTRWAKNGMFLRSDNFARTNDRKAFQNFVKNEMQNLHLSAVKYSLPCLHKSPIPPKLHCV